MQVKLRIDEFDVEVEPDLTILDAARRSGIYIPALCSHPDLPQFHSVSGSSAAYQGSFRNEGSPDAYQGCGLCLVDIAGYGMATACNTAVTAGMAVFTKTEEVQMRRRENLKAILAGHPHACLVCPQKEGCDQKSCISNVPENERCCQTFNVCELRKVVEYVSMSIDTPLYVPKGLPVVDDEPLFKRDYNLCIGCTRCVRVCSEVMGVGALTFTTTEGGLVVGASQPTLKGSGCRFCGACVEVCPTGALADKEIVWAQRQKGLVPCRNACPAGIDIPEYIRSIAMGDIATAAAVLHRDVPFPAILGRVCDHPCENACRRGKLDEPVAIWGLKRCAADLGEGFERKQPVADKTGKKVAIVGSGPAGMTCGYYLATQGHAVTIFEALPEPGGMLRYGIPEYRLPRAVLDRELEDIRRAGVEIRTNAKIESLDGIFAQGFDAIFLSLGLHASAKLGFEGEHLPEVIDGISFLRQVNSKPNITLGPGVMVIGGGNVAMDAARSALRLGAKHVRILYRRSQAEMPAYWEEVEQAEREGVRIEFLVSPRKISKNNGKLHVECLRMELGDADGSGRRLPVPIENSEFILRCDNIIAAIGQRSNVPEGFDVVLGSAGYPVVDPKTLSTSRKAVFAGGDMVSGAASVVDAIGSGKRAASAIGGFLGGEEILDSRVRELHRNKSSVFLGKESGFYDRQRVTARVPDTERITVNFEEIIGGFTRQEAINEAKRCLQCDLRLSISPPVMPPEMWTEFDSNNIASVPQKEGVFQLFDADKRVICIKGTMNLFEELNDRLRTLDKARYFIWEEEPMYSKRESELLQQYMQQHGRVPESNTELDDDLY